TDVLGSLTVSGKITPNSSTVQKDAAMYSLVRPILFRFDAEKAHHLTLNSLRSIEKLGLLPKVDSHTRQT
ncbi:quinone-dependent dihydroorotate dehydrogenase, partial [Neisseria sp. P0016.S009]